MPHSSGGGHSGGHGGSSHGGHSGGPGITPVSRHRRPGDRTFVYYRNAMPIFLYTSGDLRHGPTRKARLLSLTFVLPFLLTIAICIFGCIHVPVKRTLPADSEVIIEDNASLFTDTTSLVSAMEEFRDTTGILPAIVTVNESVWLHHYYSLEDYAYKIYCDYFPNDEGCWLIVYSKPASGIGYDFEGMQGNETDNTLSSGKTDRFNTALIAALDRTPAVSLENAFCEAYTDLTPVVMDVDVEIAPIVAMGIIGIVILTVAAVWAVKTVRYDYNPEELTEIKLDDPQKDPEKIPCVRCAYCNKLYLKDIHPTCPFCGAEATTDYTPEY